MSELLLFFSISVVCLFLYLFSKKQNETLQDLIQTHLTRSKQHEEEFFKSLTQVQIEYFKTIESTSMKLSKQMLEHFEKIEKLRQPKEVTINEKVTKKMENEIEKKETDDIPVTESMRVPIIDGMKVKFEDEEEIISPHIS